MNRLCTNLRQSNHWTRCFSTVPSSVFDSSREAFLHKNSDKVWTLSLNRPSTKNALGKQMVQQLFECTDHLSSQTPPSVLVVRSLVPGVFCAGADLKERVGMSDSQVEDFVCQLRNLCTSLENIPCPSIAALEGTALGGGLEMALACDLRVVSSPESQPKLRIGLPETSLAIIPGAGGTQRLGRLIGMAKAKELVFTARRLKADKALEIGLVSEMCDNSYERALTVAEEISGNGPIALRMAKKAIAKGMDGDLESGMEIERECYRQVLVSEDRMEGLLAFKEKRKPSYKGK